MILVTSVYFPWVNCMVLLWWVFYILNTPNRVFGMGALRLALKLSPRISRVCRGSITPSSQSLEQSTETFYKYFHHISGGQNDLIILQSAKAHDRSLKE
jgi:ABC-type transport system involved in cytochrome bd biosynthesis fused ATPase/permease subunit